MERAILDLFERHFGVKAAEIAALPLSGSARRYFRISVGEHSYIAVYNQNVPENRLFIDFTFHFETRELPVPHIYCVSEDQTIYIQEDLGRFMLLDLVEQEREGKRLSARLMDLYKQSLSELLRLQLTGGEGLDYSDCMPRPVFDRQCILWDLNYFKYCFLRLAGVDFSEQQLEDDFEKLTGRLVGVRADRFMFRDFQSRNIMVKEERVVFIDYQGGRQGALHYDVASLLYDAIVKVPEDQREELLSGYIRELAEQCPGEAGTFRTDYYHFVLIRLLQAMGAFGLRGLYERKQHFIDSIVPGLENILSLLEGGELSGEYPAIEGACRKCADKMVAVRP